MHMMIDRESAPLPALPVKVYNQIRADYLENIERTMSGTARGDQETLAEVQILDLTVQAEILTEYSSHDLLEAYKLTHIERTDISIASDDSSDFELYGANESDDDDKESSASHPKSGGRSNHEALCARAAAGTFKCDYHVGSGMDH